jgi:ParB family chromosome partitioning protein
MSNARRLGLGLDALLGDAPKPEAAPPQDLELSGVEPNPFQPRTLFDDEEIRALADSIRRTGVLQPVLVRRVNGHFQLVAGERRLRAARLAGLQRIPAVVREIDDRRMLELALVENLQRRDLNPIEKARAFQKLVETTGATQEDVGKAVGLSRPTIANFLRLLDLPPEIQEAVSRGTLSMGHARALLGTSNRALQLKLVRRIVEEDLSVRAVEQIVAGAQPAKAARPAPAKDAYTQDLERRLADFFGTRVTLAPKGRGGSLTVDWFSPEEFSGILRRLGLA